MVAGAIGTLIKCRAADLTVIGMNGGMGEYGLGKKRTEQDLSR